ncbi:helix-turn-helix transcriptional regulator [Candidatus Woesearchaeota archaeon]|nr:helix-turn-helix transcriptional regulator [Candidatus Woesearchaeota archaeon]
MGHVISDETKEEIKKLAQEGLSVRDIASSVSVSYSTVYGYVRLVERINPQTGEAFRSYREYQDYRLSLMINPKTKQAFASRAEYQKFGIQRRKNKNGEAFRSCDEYHNSLVQRLTHPETGAPFRNTREYRTYLGTQRITQSPYKELSAFLSLRLKELGLTYVQLGERVGLAGSTISSYIHARSFPRSEILRKMYRVLEAPYETLDDLLAASK